MKFIEILKNVWNIEELRNRILVTLGLLLVYRFGAQVVLPGIDASKLAEFSGNFDAGGIGGLLNAFTGGAFANASVFALGIMPYISASIIMQLMTAVTPSLEQLKKEGDAGRRKISQYTRYLTILLAIIQATAMSRGLNLAYEGASPLGELIDSLVMITSLVTGAVFMMWLGEQVTEKGIGNGISILICAGIIAGLPGAIGQAFESAQQGDLNILLLLAIILILLVIVWFVVLVERGQRRITVNYAKRQQGKKVYAAQTSHLPLKINMAGVIPAIFASSLLLFPQSIATWIGSGDGRSSEVLQTIAASLGPGQPLNLIVFTALIIFFCFFYTALMYNPGEVADNLKKSGAYIPGIRPGEQSAKYIDSVLTRLTVAGSLYMTAVCLMPQFIIVATGIPFYLGGTSLLIIVVVLMDFMSQVQSHLMSRQYESLMKKSNLKGYGGGL